MSWKTILSTIEKDINEGFSIVAPIVATFDPALGPILTEIGTIIGTIEGAIAKGSGGTITPNAVPGQSPLAAHPNPAPTDAQMSQIIQSVTAANVLKQYSKAL